MAYIMIFLTFLCFNLIPRLNLPTQITPFHSRFKTSNYKLQGESPEKTSSAKLTQWVCTKLVEANKLIYSPPTTDSESGALKPVSLIFSVLNDQHRALTTDLYTGPKNNNFCATDYLFGSFFILLNLSSRHDALVLICNV